jgi:hypothetical protein
MDLVNKQTLKRKFSGRRRASRTTARGLGWFSIGLGLAELLAPRALGRALGMPDSAGLLRAYGIREIATGIGILASKDPTPWIWARVAGDALDVTTLGTALISGNNKSGAALGLASVAGVTFADLATGQILSELAAKDRMQWRDYSNRSGFPRGAAQAAQLKGPQLKGETDGERIGQAARAAAAQPRG